MIIKLLYAMAFKLHPEARKWFDKVFGAEPFSTLFDIYQLCLVLGLATSNPEPEEQGDQFMDEFIQRYRPYQTLIIGVMLTRVLDRKGISVTDRAAVAREISRLVTGSASGGELTVDGFRELNGYAAAGFNRLRENLDDPPNNAVYLLDRYQRLLMDAAEKGSGRSRTISV